MRCTPLTPGCKTTILDEMGLDQQTTRLIMEVLSDTWFGTEGIVEVANSKRGTTPGDPLAGMIVRLLTAEVDKQITAQLRQEDLLTGADWSGSNQARQDNEAQCTAELTNVSSEDDVAYLVLANTPKQCVKG
jgi:hypothetical protein